MASPLTISTVVSSSAAAVLAETLLLQDRRGEAERYSSLAEELTTDDDAASGVAWRSVRAKLAAAAGRTGDAERLARVALKLASATESPPLQAEAATALGEVLLAAGRQEEGAQALRDAQQLWERKGNVVAAERVGERVAVGAQ